MVKIRWEKYVYPMRNATVEHIIEIVDYSDEEDYHLRGS